MKRTPVISIIGRPNVGKSTIFNRILGNSYKAITFNTPGVTRDRHYGIYRYEDSEGADQDSIIIDTGGFFPEAKQDLRDEMHTVLAQQAEIAIQESDLVLVVVDIREGLLPFDQSIVNFTRKEQKELWIVINKFDSDKQIGQEADFYKFGDEKYFLTSAEHNRGLGDLKESIEQFCEKYTGENDNGFAGVKPNFKLGGRLAIIGAPNVGKSTLLNQLVGAQRAVVSNVAGTTVDPIEGFFDINLEQEAKYFEKDVFHFRNDAISTYLKDFNIDIDVEHFEEDKFYDESVKEDDKSEFTDKEVEMFESVVEDHLADEVIEETRRSVLLVDTAGIRRRSNIEGFIETQSVYRSLRSITDSDVVLYLVDGQIGLTHQDKKLISVAIEKGKSVIICINKIDLKPEVYADKKEKKEFILDFEEDIPWINYCRPVFISAQKGIGVKTLMKVVQETLVSRRKMISTSELNKQLNELFETNPVMVRGGKKGARELRLKYAAMVKGSPPTFLLFTNRSLNIPKNYRRYLINGIRKKFPFTNTPIHLIFRSGRGMIKEE